MKNWFGASVGTEKMEVGRTMRLSMFWKSGRRQRSEQGIDLKNCYDALRNGGLAPANTHLKISRIAVPTQSFPTHQKIAGRLQSCGTLLGSSAKPKLESADVTGHCGPLDGSCLRLRAIWRSEFEQPGYRFP